METFQSVFAECYWSGYHPLRHSVALNHVDHLSVSNYLTVKQ